VETSGGWLIADEAASLELDDFKFNQCHQRCHCEPTGRANARPMTGSAKQSRAAKEDWIASSQELLAMTELAIPI
jgi:hypothetical protein